ncbi:hypothetical protein BEP19_08045 [Ammoniphilus oxalaticus]|uniref:Uncharacterized protein n=1 Tax=Ammoniphilus oxalaticus TaxID=66863 RepID=A0A419SKA7_9BACL|nr:hypothetical protein BEP19_08045 [Ammoniphilus oxalaticus]
MGRYIGEFKLSRSDKLLYFYEDGPYIDVLEFLKQMTNSEPKYIRSTRAWTVPLKKLTKKELQEQLQQKGWEGDIK